MYSDAVGQPTVPLLPLFIAFLIRDFFSSGVRASHALRISFMASLRFGPPFGSSEEDCSITIIFYFFTFFFWKGKWDLGFLNLYRAWASSASVLSFIFFGDSQTERRRPPNYETPK